MWTWVPCARIVNPRQNMGLAYLGGKRSRTCQHLNHFLCVTQPKCTWHSNFSRIITMEKGSLLFSQESYQSIELYYHIFALNFIPFRSPDRYVVKLDISYVVVVVLFKGWFLWLQYFLSAVDIHIRNIWTEMLLPWLILFTCMLTYPSQRLCFQLSS